MGMNRKNLIYDEKILADILRGEILKTSEPKENISKEENFSNIEYISKAQEEISPILQMNEDQVLDFVESFDVSQLATLSVKELNYIGEVLGVEPKILFGLED